MPAAPLHPNEAARLDALQRLRVLDTPPEAEFDDLTRLAAAVCGTPIALVSLIDTHRQWFKSRYGLAVAETPRDIAFCAHAILQPDLFEVPDAAADARFAANPLVTADPNIRFYAGVPLVTPDGHPVGTLCAIDRVPRALTAEQRDALRVLGRQVVAQLQLRTQVHQLAKEAREYETFRALFDNSSDAYLVYEDATGIVDCNRAAVAMLGYPNREAVIGRRPRDFSPEFQPCGRSSADKAREVITAARRDGVCRFDWVHRRPNGEEFPTQVTLTPVTLHGRNVLLVVWHDLTERVRADEALRFQAALRGSLTESGPDGILVVDPDARILSLNRRFLDIWQIPPEVVAPGDDMLALAAAVAHTADPSGFRARVEEIYAHPDMVAADEVALADGRVLERHSGPVRGADGRHYGRVWYFRDVTARKRAEEAVRAGEARFRGAFDHAPIGMALVGLDGRWLRVNRAVCDILGYTSAELLATDFQTLTHPDDLGADLHQVRQVLAGEIASYQMEKRYFRKGGAVVHAVLSVSLARDTKGRPLYFISHINDVSARKQAEVERRESEERFRAAMEGSLDAVFFLAAERDQNGVVADFRFTDLNTRGAKLVSREREEVIGRRLCELLPVNRTDGFFDKYVRVVQTGETLEEEFPVAAGGVAAGWLHHQVVKVGDGVAITTQDVTARKRAELELRASEEQLRTLGDNLPDGVVFQYVVGTDGRHRFPYMSRGIDRLAGVTAEAVMADADVLFRQTHPDDVGPLAAAIGRSMQELSEFDMEIRRINQDGGMHWFHARTAPRRLPDGSTAWDGVMIDVTDRKRAEDELRASEEKFRTTLDRLAEGVFVVDVDTGRIVDVNAATLDMLGYTRDEFLALSQFDLMSGETEGSIERSAEQVRQRLAADGRCDMGRRAFRRKDGTPVPVDIKVTLVPNGRAGLHAVIARDVTEQVEYEEQLLAYQEELERANARLRALATTDGLTGLKNRATFDEKLTDEFERAVRHGRQLSLVMLDVDHFKAFNDAFGHPAGDVVLQQVARTLAGGVRGTDVVARYGGEEFVLLLPDTDDAGAMALAERLRRAVAGTAWEQRPITVSVGVSTLTPDTPDAAVLVQEADQALYRSKQAGRDRVTGSNVLPQITTTRIVPIALTG